MGIGGHARAARAVADKLVAWYEREVPGNQGRS
jgi:hypothetical protein